MPSNLLLNLCLGSLVVVSLLFVIEKWALAPPPTIQEWLGDEKTAAGLFPRIRSCLSEWTKSLELLRDGYLQV
jgi:hypothetical protein